uniref:NADH-ubiquinone oxidoreductase chain 4L n=1 Tax=Cofana yasumatsui TaxID=2741154 RepID=A0A6M8PQ50_9HEMI|nr:NADH dehydrogenase subunit 4L [Cofana yasumatsui]QKG63364.1 NADH dehydrogenase subunit 4L [Cofana yasumatsui]
MNMFMYVLIFMFSLISVIYIRKHILLCLMNLEFVILTVLLVIFNFCLLYNYNFYIYIFYMTFFVCEGSLGLSILVSMLRNQGNDYLNSIVLW